MAPELRRLWRLSPDIPVYARARRNPIAQKKDAKDAQLWTSSTCVDFPGNWTTRGKTLASSKPRQT